MKIADKIRINHTVLHPEEQIPAHVQDTWELSYVMIGRGVRTIGDTTEAFSEGEVILIPPGLSHQWIFEPGHTDDDGNISDTTLFFSPDLLSEIARLLPDFAGSIGSITLRKAAVKFEGRRKRMLQKLMLRLSREKTPEMKLVYFLSLLTLLDLRSDGEEAVGRHIDSSPTKRKVEKITIYCECNYMKRITLGDAARHIGMNLSSFCKFFLRNFGCTFTAHINHLRVNESCRRLKNTSDPVADVAYSVGFSSVPYFNRIFKRRCGCTPLQYRIKSSALP